MKYIHIFKHILNLFLDCHLKELDQQELLSVILSIVEHCHYNIFHESIVPGLRNFKYQPGKVVWVGLEQIEQVLIALNKE